MAIFSEEILKKTNFKINTSVDLINAGRTGIEDRYAKEFIEELVTLNNVLLKTIDLSQYPSLTQRVTQGTILNEEYQEFLFDSGIDPNSVKDLFLSDFPTKIDLNTVTNLFLGNVKNYLTLADIINTVGGYKAFLEKVKSDEFLRTPTLINVDRLLQEKVILTDSVGKQVGSVNVLTGEILDTKDKVLGIIDEGDNILTPEGDLIVGPDGRIRDEDGEIDLNAPELGGYDGPITGTPDPIAIPPITIPASEYNNPGAPVQRFVPGIGTDNPENWLPSSDMQNYLLRLDFFYDKDFGVLLADIESKFINPFDEMSSLTGLSIDEMPFDPVTNISEKQTIDVQHSVDEEFKEYDTAFNNLMVEIDNIGVKLGAKVLGIDDRVTRFLTKLNTSSYRMGALLNSSGASLRLLTSVNGIGQLKQKVANIANMYRLQFEKMVDFDLAEPFVIPKVMDILQISLEDIGKHIEKALDQKVNQYKILMDNIEASHNSQKLKSYTISKRAMDAGAIRINPTKAKDDAKNHGENVNSSVIADLADIESPSMYYVDQGMSDDEEKIIEVFKPSDNIADFANAKTSYLTMDPSILELYETIQTLFHEQNGNGIPNHRNWWSEDANGPGRAYSMIYEKNPMLLVRLHRMGELLGTPINMVMGYQSPYVVNVYRIGVKKEKNISPYDPSQSCHFALIELSDSSGEGKIKHINAASKAGFKGIKIVKSLMALSDVGDMNRSLSVDIDKYYKDIQIKKAIEKHLNQEYTDGKK